CGQQCRPLLVRERIGWPVDRALAVVPAVSVRNRDHDGLEVHASRMPDWIAANLIAVAVDVEFVQEQFVRYFVFHSFSFVSGSAAGGAAKIAFSSSSLRPMYS